MKYISRTLSKGKIYVKLIKALRLIQHVIYYILSKKIGEYDFQTSEIEIVGYIEKSRVACVKKEYQKYFKECNILNEKTNKNWKISPVLLAYYDGVILIRKSFYGILGINKFYTELICLDRLKKVYGTPNIHFVDYSKCTIYMNYIDGYCLHKIRIAPADIITHAVPESFSTFKATLNNIHENGVVVYDLKDSNMILYLNNAYYIDFADSVYYSMIITLVFRKLKDNDNKKIEKLFNSYKIIAVQNVFQSTK